MVDWLLTIGLAALVAGAAALGARSHGRRGWWVYGVTVPLGLIMVVSATRRFPALEFGPGMWLLCAGRREFAVVGVATALLFGTLVPRLRKRPQRIAVTLFATSAIIAFSLFPFAAPAVMHARLARLTTRREPAHGYCLQSTGYTCGPAAAVSALSVHGITAEEGEIACLAHTCPWLGTQPDSLATALNARYGDRGIIGTHRWFDSPVELRDALPAVVVLRHSAATDHYVTVLSITADTVTIADPLQGLTQLAPAEFQARWRRVGVSVLRPSSP